MQIKLLRTLTQEQSYKYQLDRRELLVMKENIPNDGDESCWRISKDGAWQIEEPLVFATDAVTDDEESGPHVDMASP